MSHTNGTDEFLQLEQIMSEYKRSRSEEVLETTIIPVTDRVAQIARKVFIYLGVFSTAVFAFFCYFVVTDKSANKNQLSSSVTYKSMVKVAEQKSILTQTASNAINSVNNSSAVNALPQDKNRKYAFQLLEYSKSSGWAPPDFYRKFDWRGNLADRDAAGYLMRIQNMDKVWITKIGVLCDFYWADGAFKETKFFAKDVLVPPGYSRVYSVEDRASEGSTLNTARTTCKVETIIWAYQPDMKSTAQVLDIYPDPFRKDHTLLQIKNFGSAAIDVARLYCIAYGSEIGTELPLYYEIEYSGSLYHSDNSLIAPGDTQTVDMDGYHATKLGIIWPKGAKMICGVTNRFYNVVRP